MITDPHDNIAMHDNINVTINSSTATATIATATAATATDPPSPTRPAPDRNFAQRWFAPLSTTKKSIQKIHQKSKPSRTYLCWLFRRFSGSPSLIRVCSGSQNGCPDTTFRYFCLYALASLILQELFFFPYRKMGKWKMRDSLKINVFLRKNDDFQSLPAATKHNIVFFSVHVFWFRTR